MTVLALSSRAAMTLDSVAFSIVADLEFVLVPSLLPLNQLHCLPGFAYVKESLRMTSVQMSRE